MSLLSTIAAVAPKVMQKMPKFAGKFAQAKQLGNRLFTKLGIPASEQDAVREQIGAGIQGLMGGQGQQQGMQMPSVDMPQMSQVDLGGMEVPGTMAPGQMGAVGTRPRRRANLYGGMS